jgi:hypothetical protein
MGQIEYRTLDCCDRCGSNEIRESSFNEIHGHRYVCESCQYTCWGGRLKNKEKNEKRPPCPSAADLGVDQCQICRLKRKFLGYGNTLEVHHLDGNPQNNEIDNLIVACTHHHKWIHHEIIYYNEHFMQLVRNEDEF